MSQSPAPTDSGTKYSKNPGALRNIKRMLRDFLIELIIYGGLVTVYYILVLRLLSGPLEFLYDRYLPFYAFAALLLIVAQGVILESITRFLLSRLGLGFHE